MKRFGVIWDLDGTITDSFDLFFDALVTFLDRNRFGVRLERESYKAAYFGQTVDSILTSLSPRKLDAAELNQLGTAYTDICAELAADARSLRVVPGADRIIRALHEAGIPQAIGSSSVLKMIQRELCAVGLCEYFDNAVSGSRLPSKPAPDIFRVAAASLGLAAADCVVFEDSTVGVQAAKAAGARCVAITTTKRREDLHEADLIIDAYADLSVEQISEMFRI